MLLSNAMSSGLTDIAQLLSSLRHFERVLRGLIQARLLDLPLADMVKVNGTVQG